MPLYGILWHRIPGNVTLWGFQKEVKAYFSSLGSHTVNQLIFVAYIRIFL